MNWSNVRLILAREIRDQLRDRRTLFMVAVLPILLYPLLGTSFSQMLQFRRERPMRVLVFGARSIEGLSPPLVVNREFAPALFAEPGKSGLLELSFAPGEPAVDVQAEAERAVQIGSCDAALVFPADFARRVQDFRRWLAEKRSPAGPYAPPQPEIVYSTANDRSQIAHARLSLVLDRWAEQLLRSNLSASGLPEIAARPIDVKVSDIADERGRGAAAWSKILPVLLLVWALTGAFYPAIDLCAGEKERGTLETLLSSPAQRSEIVLGKLATIMLFSAVTAALNLASMGLTGWLVIGRAAGFGPPPFWAVVWLGLALVPIAALFSALSLALAAFARSTKEGQYYLMPLMLVVMPLAVLSTAPGMELNLGNSLIPISNIVLLLRTTIEGNYAAALRYAAPVIAVTLLCCLLAIRWAVEQFNSESVLFRESERLDLGLWVQHLLRDRQATPTPAAALFCGVLILVVQFFFGLAMRPPEGFADFAAMAAMTQLAVVLAPALLMTAIAARSFRQTLLLRWPSWRAAAGAVLLALLLQPLVGQMQVAVTQLYPLNDDVKQMLERVFGGPTDWRVMLLVVALVPALCEEIAFRGFILSGFRHLGHRWRAVLYSALFFGLTHAVFQQSLVAAIVGLVIGALAVQTGSLLPCVLFHFTHNATRLALPELAGRLKAAGHDAWLGVDGGFAWPLTLVTGILAALLFGWFLRLPHQPTAEEAEVAAMAPDDADD